MPGAPPSYLNDGVHYDACHAHRLDDVPFWTQAASSCRSVLELGCGTGRIAIPVAATGAAAGRRVIGIDSNPSMLDQARRKARAAGVEIDYVLGDMRGFDLGRDDIDLAILSFNTINVLATLDDALACLRCTRRHLAPTGRLILDTFLPSPQRLLPEELQIDYTLPDGVKITITANRSYDPAHQLRTLDLVIRSSEGGPLQTDRSEVHVYYPSELVLLLTQAGFEVVAAYGSYDQRRLDARSHRLILVASPRA
ncbi:MAG TPA: methyltransferase domain-containing protein [Kofleriaceae bacterium]|nr:methyltransferase domain-containing protein [Kofleriaceae bacterium]